ncbi:MAG TPA: lipoprotein [Aestuariivirgaceae bacterium]|jgi:predicted small lipoprotein YifL|nr:lipoprotein [Aestuariivirgaceae bacterium]
MRSILLVLAATLLLAGCGARGPLEPPPGSTASQKQKNPDFILDKAI